MDGATHITVLRDETHVTSTQVSDAQALRYLNAAYHRAIKAIIEFVGEDYFFDIWTTAAVVSQANGEYVFPEQDTTNAGMAKLKELQILMQSTDDYFRKARQVDVRALQYAWDWYLTNQSAADPIYFVADRSVFIAPQFTSTMVPNPTNSQIKLLGIKQAVDLTASTGEAGILVPREFHLPVIVGGAKQYVYAQLGKSKEKNDAMNEAEAERNSMVALLSDRDQSIGVASLPSESDLE